VAHNCYKKKNGFKSGKLHLGKYASWATWQEIMDCLIRNIYKKTLICDNYQFNQRAILNELITRLAHEYWWVLFYYLGYWIGLLNLLTIQLNLFIKGHNIRWLYSHVQKPFMLQNNIFQFWEKDLGDFEKISL
jgi:hypothetical protein